MSSTSSANKTTIQIALAHKRIVGYCIYASLALVSVSFNITLLLALPQFRKQFGYKYQGDYVIPAIYQAVWNAMLVPGGIVGCLISGPINNRLGRRYCFIIGSIFLIASTLVQNLALEWKAMTAGLFIYLVVSFMYFVGSVTYVSEITPLGIRGAMLASLSIVLTIAWFINACIVEGTQYLPGKMSYLIPIVKQYLIPTIMFIFSWFIPESPYWLVEKGNTDAARLALKRLYRDREVEETLQEIEAAIRSQEKATNLRYLDCFRGSNLRRTTIAIGVMIGAEVVGSVFVFGYAPYFFILAGLPQSESFAITSIMSAVQIVATIAAFFLVERIGRRPLLLWGLAVMLVSHLIIGGIGTSSRYATGALPKVVASFIAIFSIAYKASIGTIPWVISGEVCSPATRASTQAITMGVNAIVAFVVYFTLPYLINPDQANLGPKVCLIYAGMTFLVLIFCFSAVPEMKGRTYQEIDYMFQHRIPTRKFKGFKFQEGMLGPMDTGEVDAHEAKEV